MNKHNFYADPSILPQYTIDKSIEGIKDFAGTGLSVLDISHRSLEFVACASDICKSASSHLAVAF